ncbi:MAG: outer membrane protein assembly factor BamD [Bacteroidetes bacterium]|nr:outer membrane protein assembly factor BamD [Bacteroidota bacterium]
MFKKAAFSLFCLSILVLSGCNGYQKLLKSTDNTEKFEAAVKYYHKGDYDRALQLFDQIIPFFRGTDKAEQINYYIAQSYFQQQDYIMASYYFKSFAKNFPNSNLAEECMYMNAFCKYLDSPEYSLDQTNTFEAITEFQLFINMFPNSARVGKCNDIMDELRAKLERKDYEIGKLYYKMGDYQAAITSLKNVYKDFPDTKYKEDLLFLILKAYVSFAQNSVPAKQPERYKGAMEAYNTLVTFFPSTSYLREANQLKKSIIVQP